MRVLLRVLAPLLGIVLAAGAVLVVIEVVAAWVLADAEGGLLVPWRDWSVTLANLSWNENPVPGIAIGVGVVGLLLIIVGLAARRGDVRLEAPAMDMTVTTSPRVLARLVGTRVRAADDVLSASVTASARRIAVHALVWQDAPLDQREVIVGRISELLDELPLRRRPRVTVSVRKQEGLR
ncbi:MAG TPA: DUF6286 domain-containing protein [Pseudonocardia sp.]